MGILRLLLALLGGLLVAVGLLAICCDGALPLLDFEIGVTGARLFVAAGIALALVASIWGQALGAFGGSMATLGMLAIIVALAPEITIGGSGNGSSEELPVGQRLNALYEDALDSDPITLGAEAYEEAVLTESGGLAVRYVEVEEAAQLRIGAVDNEAYPSADPYISVFRPGENGHLDRVPLGTDDDGGGGLSSYLELMVEPGTYLVELRNIGHTVGEGEATIDLEMSAVTRTQIEDELAARVVRQFPEEGALDLGSPLLQWSGDLTGAEEEPLYRFDVDGSADSCLVVDVMPGVFGAPQGDTVLRVFNVDRSVDLVNDDWQEGHFGSRIIAEVDATEDGAPSVLYAEIRPFDRGAQLSFEARATVLPRNGACPSLEGWEGPQADY